MECQLIKQGDDRQTQNLWRFSTYALLRILFDKFVFTIFIILWKSIMRERERWGGGAGKQNNGFHHKTSVNFRVKKCRQITQKLCRKESDRGS